MFGLPKFEQILVHCNVAFVQTIFLDSKCKTKHANDIASVICPTYFLDIILCDDDLLATFVSSFML